MVVGFTGTRMGMTPRQKHRLAFWLETNRDVITEVRHGDCVGSDMECHGVCMSLDIPIRVFPPSDPKLRAYCSAEGSNLVEPEAPYLERNRSIVDGADILLATPAGPEVRRSGTWSTVRYAKKRGVETNTIMPDGRWITVMPDGESIAT